MKRVFLLMLLCGICIGGRAAAQASNPAVHEAIPFETVFQGWYANGIVERTALVVNDTGAYRSVWEVITRGVFPTPPAPPVDFETTTLIFVSSGVMPSGGYEVEIERIVAVDDGLEVEVVISEPPEDAAVTAALTQPYHGVVLNKTALPVRFHWETR